MSIGLRTYIPLPTVLADVVIQYARPFIVAIAKPDHFFTKKRIFEKCMPLITSVLLTENISAGMLPEVKRILSSFNIPFKQSRDDVPEPERLEIIQAEWGKPDFVMNFSTYDYVPPQMPSLYSDWMERFVSLELDICHSIWDEIEVILFSTDYIKRRFHSPSSVDNYKCPYNNISLLLLLEPRGYLLDEFWKQERAVVYGPMET